MKKILFSLLLITLAITKLNVISPEVLKKKFPQGINYTIANFGFTPYGQSIIGEVLVSDPLFACSPVKSSISNHKMPVFLLVERGNCSFVTKVHYAKLMGAKLVIIMDDRVEHSENIIMSDDFSYYNLDIPSIFIKKKDGLNLINYLKENKNEAIELNVKFVTIKKEKVNYVFWVTTSNRNTFKLIRDFKPYHQKLGNNVNFSVHYAIWKCYRCKPYTSENFPTNCISKGRYCSPDPDGNGAGTGRDIVMEDLRQICIYKHFQKDWWDYMILFDENCFKPQVEKDCSKDMMKKINIDHNAIKKCVDDSFMNKNYNYLTDDNSILKQEREIIERNGVLFWPSISINNMPFRGNLESNGIFEAICTSFDKDHTPEVCYDILGIPRNNVNEFSSKNIFLIIAIVIIILLIFFIILIPIYRRIVKKEMSKEMNGQVNQMVSQYIAFYESREKKDAV